MRGTVSGRIIFFLLFLLVVDLCLAPFLRLGDARPVFIYLALAYAAFEWQWENTTLLAVVVGLMRDLMGTHPFGVEMAVLFFTSWILDVVSHKIDRSSLFMRVAVTFLFVFVALAGVWIVSRYLSPGKVFSWFALWACFQSACYTTLCLPFFFYFASHWFEDRPSVKQYELFK